MKNRFIVSPFFLDDNLPELTSLATEGWIINSPVLSGETKQARMSVIHGSLARFVEETVKSGERPVSIAGDCCTSIGVLAGLQRSQINPTLIWFDAHGDFNTWETTPSGFLGGMPLAMIVGRGEQTMLRAAGLKTLPENQVILTDARDLDPGESGLVEKSDVVHLRDIATLLTYPLPDGPLYVHFDTDLVSVEEVPAQNYPAQGGPSSSAVRAVFRRLAQSGRIIGASLSSWNPKLDKALQSQTICMSLLHTLIDAD